MANNLDFDSALEDLDSIPLRDLLFKPDRFTKYEKMLLENQIHLDPEFIIKESIGVLKSEMNSLGLSSCQQSVCKEVRQKGRNLIHAQSHRRAKQNEIEKLQESVREMRQMSLTLKETYRRLEEDRDEVYQKFDSIMKKNFQLSFD